MVCFLKTDPHSYLVWFIFFKKCSSNNGKCSACSLCWYEVVSLCCSQDNYGSYHLLEGGLTRTKIGAFSQEHLEKGGAQGLQMQFPIVRWALECTALLQLIKSSQPRPTTSSPLIYMQVDSPCSSVYLQNTNWVIWNLGFVPLRHRTQAGIMNMWHTLLGWQRPGF